MASINWKNARRENGEEGLVAIPGIYRFVTDATGKKLVFGNFTRSFQIKALDGDILVAFNRTALDAADSPNAWELLQGDPPLYEQAQTSALYVKSVSGSVEVQILVTFSDQVVPYEWGELTAGHGFDGNGASQALEDLA